MNGVSFEGFILALRDRCLCYLEKVLLHSLIEHMPKCHHSVNGKTGKIIISYPANLVHHFVKLEACHLSKCHRMT